MSAHMSAHMSAPTINHQPPTPNQESPMPSMPKNPRPRRAYRQAGRPELAGPAAGQMMCQQTICCPRCLSPLARECSDSKIDPATGIRTIRGYCEHCAILAVGRYRLGGGIWNLEGQVECHSDRASPPFKSFLARLAVLRGDIAGTITPQPPGPVPAA